ncbi:hypothetical protein GHT06_012320 [Daphnia sinensis]|uniref:W2 domain-containing protein n=1 Tax=Daphnia sinensis TaxID=1820382 RepID=A0AAD5LP15_9CRUS|nr:hypothetical protein GHT06_012320 [Daphnia sinensis]
MPIPFLLGSVPTNLKSIQQYLDVAADYDTTDVSVSYWSRLYALQQGFSLLKDKEDLEFLLDLMEWLGGKKDELKSLKTVCDLVEAQLHVENVAQNLLTWAESGFQLFPINQFNKIVVGAFSSAKILLDVCSIFGDLKEEMAKKKKYASLHVVNMKNCSTPSNTETTPKILTTLKHKSDPHPVISKIDDKSSEAKKIYDRIFLLNLRNKPSSMKQPRGLLIQEVVRVGQNEEDVSKKAIEPKSSVSPKLMPVALKKFTELMNELNPSTWEKLLPTISGFRINTAKLLWEITGVIYDKAIEEPNMLPFYANLCRFLWFRKVSYVSNPSKTTNFRAMMLSRVLKEFEKTYTSTTGVKTEKEEVKSGETVQPNSVDNPQENQRIDSVCKEMKKLEITPGEKSGREHTFTNIKFIAELFKMKLVAAHVMHDCIVWLLDQNEDESALECLCSVLVAIGKELENPKERPTANPRYLEDIHSYYRTLEAILDKTEISDRVRALIQNVIDMRNNGWLSREDNKSSIKIQQDPSEFEEQDLKKDLSFEKDSSLIDDFSRHAKNALQNGEGTEHAKQEIEQISETPKIDQKPSSKADEKVCPLVQEAATPSVIKIIVDDKETRGDVPNGGHKRENGTARVEDVETNDDSGCVLCESPTEKSNYKAFQQRLKQYLREETQSTTDEICIWIQKEYVGEVDSTFIRALMTCIIETSIEGSGMESKLNHAVFKQRVEVLRRYVGKVIDREVQVVSVIQTLLNKCQHPEGLIRSILETLGNGHVISEASVQSWVFEANPSLLEENLDSLDIKLLVWFNELVMEAEQAHD